MYFENGGHRLTLRMPEVLIGEIQVGDALQPLIGVVDVVDVEFVVLRSGSCAV